MASQQSSDDISQNHIILVHGLGADPTVYWLLRRRLRRKGFSTKTWGYFSFRGSIEKHAERLVDFLNRFPCRDKDKIHLVGHSMGSIICRRVLLDLPIENLGRVVLMAPPNQGSPVATRLNPFFGRICPAIKELSDSENSYVRTLNEPEGYQIGVIQALRDWLVPLENTRLSTAQETVALPLIHSGVLFSREAAELVAQFLTTGSFDQEVT